LPAPGVAIARFALDAELARVAAAQGAEVVIRTRVTALAGSLAAGFEAHTTGSAMDRVRARCVIGAFGRHPLALHALRRPPASRQAVAFKMHRVGPHGLSPRVELHAFEDGYVGFAPLSPERVNVCWVAQQGAIRAMRGGGDAAPFLRVATRVQPLQSLLACTQEDTAARCAESGVQFGAPRPLWQDVLLAGDAAVTPHPLSGDGMAMGVRAGRFAAAYALAFLREDLRAAALPEAYARAWRREFSNRLRWDSALHAILERPAVATPLLRVLGRWPAAFEALVARTRGHAVPQSPTVEVPR
jgi:flavin-dependent dehydrogenase